MNVLDVFSGIGGFSLGLERAGMRTVAFCEIDPYCQAVLRKHWPDVPIWSDVCELAFDEGWPLAAANTGHKQSQEQIRAGRQSIDLICGGFPCQDISVAGKGAGIEGERSGLWSEYARIIGEVRPRYVIVENVAALLGRGIERVLGDLAALGYDAEWHCIPASAVGAPHRRDRVWIVAHSASSGRRPKGPAITREANGRRTFCESCGTDYVADANKPGSQGLRDKQIKQRASRFFGGRFLGNSDWWLTEPDVGRVAHGIPFRVDRLRALGNAIVPQIAEIIGKAIMQHEARLSNLPYRSISRRGKRHAT